MATIKDVAKSAGVSIATVSRVLNGSANVKQATRDAIQRTIQELNYMPNALARGLQKKQSKTIGVLFPDATSYYFAEIIRGINTCIQQAGYRIVVSSAHDAADEANVFLSLWKSQQVSGMIVMMPSTHNATIFNSTQRSIPLILLNTAITDGADITITIDNYQGAKEITKHLIEHGHQAIGFIHGAPNNHDSEERYRGYQDALNEGNLTRSSHLEFHGNFTENSGYRAVISLLNQSEKPTAIFAANDAMAIGAVEAARQLSLQVPQDIAIVGFDDISTARYINPPLTTMNVPVLEIGEMAGNHLIRLLEDNRQVVTREITVPVHLVVRESCGCPKEK
ncbi:MAG: LacI family DNA-binding transcriptional regulator [Candidatus Marinimicrobia bacterium]|nr:LacI family DNA-binding transcriptional regulator [Candidatus Neomarinimicrobiota bacterium]